MHYKKILITGGAGNIGSHIADHALAADGPLQCDNVVVLDNFVRGRRENLAAALKSGKLELVEGDILDRDLLARCMDGVDLVFHEAAIRITQCAEEPRLAFDVLGTGTFNVVDAAMKAKVKKFVSASSASVLGMADEFPTPESHHPYNNRTLYGALKTFNEGLLRSYNDMFGLDYIALRYFNVYGPRMDMHGVFTEVFIRWMERIDAGQAPLILGDGKQTMDFINVEDIARANILAAVSDVSDDVFNVASGTETSLNELAEMLLKVMGSDRKPEYGPARSVNPVARRIAEVKRAERMIGFKAEIDLEEGLRRLVDWWRSEKAIVAGSQS